MSLDHSVSLVFRVSEKEKRRILAQSVYYLHLSTPIVLANEYNVAVELIRSLEYGTAVSSLREAAEIRERRGAGAAYSAFV